MKHYFSEAAGPIVEVQSPGRINLIGEHTDYNEGFVLPAAINQYIRVAIQPRADREVKLVAHDLDKAHHTTLDDFAPIPHHWSNYVMGVVDQLLMSGRTISGFELHIESDLPSGAGLSSSAALQSAVIFGLNQIFDLQLSRYAMALMVQSAEQKFAGVQCGIMDPYACLFGKKGYVLQLDCRKNQHHYFPLELGDYKIVLFNTNVKHSLASTAYNQRRHECEAGLALVQEQVPAIKSVRDINFFMVEAYIKNPLLARRCRYVIQENTRLLSGCEDLRTGNLEAFGKKMYASHEGLKKEYEVSCDELDWLIDKVRVDPAVAGARMMGGGFGGCTINLVAAGAIASLTASLSVTYEKVFGKQLHGITVETADGVQLM